ncbi:MULTISPECIES: hypothetical protein [Rhodococcus]|uniref:hypothetical protein n=1 Tax=Rhodococcus TaxID=1827 RepID=UPI001E525B0C|nr:hypothetical protein [Rhodococcus pyridinivorans]MCD2116812.1 hypothetical protein [Rhodococcus pyridinivorans]MCZ4625980.1 hypothetical protein [Rhodococcus pyridinivorans]MCZ4646935.1 hypothetical protein [Rhodococcus pyridinivorans]MDJ0480287.1 hypothetical protein [Rhodococcus pyridinivorans]MDV7253038.1 hypothetical protein [Rhodococcus pyridinivorans]
MPTALQVADGLGGWAGPATLYRVDPPINGCDHLLLFHQKSMYGQSGQMVVMLADENAQVKDARPTFGSHATDDPNHPFTLQMAGGYRLVQSVDEMGA